MAPTRRIRRKADGTCGIAGCHGPYVAEGRCRTHLAELTRDRTARQRASAAYQARVYSGAGRRRRVREHVSREYDVSIGWYDDRLIEQLGRCGICNEPMTANPKEPCVDHDHASGIARALLCLLCNSALSHVEDTDWAARARAYLVQHGTIIVAPRRPIEDVRAELLARVERRAETVSRCDHCGRGG